MSTTITLRGTQDSFTNENAVTTNYGNQPRLGMSNTAANRQRTYMGFSMKTIPKDANVKSALLRFYLKDAWAAANTITARRIITSWREDTINWNKVANNNVADTTATNLATVVVTGGVADQLVEIDVTAMVVDATAAGAVWHGIRLTVDTNGAKHLHSTEASSHLFRPKLVIAYAETPDAPTKLRPRGGHAVNAASPKLAWDSDNLSYSYVQVSANSDMSAPFYDSGYKSNTDPFWDLALASTPSFTPMADAATVYWRVRIKSEDGDASPWSETSTFTRHVFGVTTITSPAVDGDGVDESTPTFIFSFTGQTQVAFAWDFFSNAGELSFPLDPTFRHHREASTEVSFELASFDPHKLPLLSDTSFEYKVVVYVYDQYDRATAVGETSYSDSDTRQFIYSPAAGTTVVSALSAAQDGPFVDLLWTRASAPDSYDIHMDGRIIDQKIDPADVFVSGTDYLYQVYHGITGRAHVFKVIATDDHVDSISNPTITYTPHPRGIWLLSPNDHLQVPIWGKDQPSMILGETGTTFELLHRPTPVRIVDSIRGLEGSISGRMQTVDSYDVVDAFDALMAMKSLSPSTTFRMIIGQLNIPVILGEVTIAPSSDPLEEAYDVTINYWQDSEFDVK